MDNKQDYQIGKKERAYLGIIRSFFNLRPKEYVFVDKGDYFLFEVVVDNNDSGLGKIMSKISDVSLLDEMGLFDVVLRQDNFPLLSAKVYKSWLGE